MATIKLNHVPLLVDAASFLEWKRFITQILQSEGYWLHVEGTANAYDIFPASYPPTTPTATSPASAVTAYQKWWQKDAQVRGIILRRVSPVTFSLLNTTIGVTARALWAQLHTTYARIDIMAQFDLKQKLQNMRLYDYRDFDRYIGEFKTGRERLLQMKVTYAEDDMVHQIIRGLPSDGTHWPQFRQLMIQVMQDHLNNEAAASAAGTGTAAPDTLLNRVISRINIECQRLESEAGTLKVYGPESEYLDS